MPNALALIANAAPLASAAPSTSGGAPASQSDASDRFDDLAHKASREDRDPAAHRVRTKDKTSDDTSANAEEQAASVNATSAKDDTQVTDDRDDADTDDKADGAGVPSLPIATTTQDTAQPPTLFALMAAAGLIAEPPAKSVEGTSDLPIEPSACPSPAGPQTDGPQTDATTAPRNGAGTAATDTAAGTTGAIKTAAAMPAAMVPVPAADASGGASNIETQGAEVSGDGAPASGKALAPNAHSEMAPGTQNPFAHAALARVANGGNSLTPLNAQGQANARSERAPASDKPAARSAIAADGARDTGGTSQGATTPATASNSDLAALNSHAKPALPDAAAPPAPQADTAQTSTPIGTLAADGAQRPTTNQPVVHVKVHNHGGEAQLPAEQIAIAITRQSRQGANRFEIRLDPPELGRIDVRLEVGADGRATALLSADRRETLDLLTRDSRMLQKTLADAGVTADQNALQFSLRHDNSGNGRGRFDTSEDKLQGETRNEDVATLAPPVHITASLGPGRLDLRV